MAGRNYADIAADDEDSARRAYYMDPCNKGKKAQLREAVATVTRAYDNQDQVGAGRGLVNPDSIGHNEGPSMTDARRRQINSGN